MDTERTSIKDIARQLGKHHSTVSRALRNDPSISEETRRLVAKTARQLGYLPDPRLSELMTRVQKGPRLAIDDTIAVTVPPAGSELARSDSVGVILDAAVAAIVGFGYKAERFIHEEETMPLARIQKIAVARGYRGLLVFPSSDAAVEFAPEPGIACVGIGVDTLPGVNMPRVCFDAFHSMRLALTSLREKEGHNSILVCLMDPVFACPRERYLAACNLPIESGAVVTVVASAGSSETSRREALNMATKSSASSILLDDLEQFRTLSSATCDKDLFLIGNLHEGIPGFQLPLKDIGRKAAEILISRIKAGGGAPEGAIDCTLLRGHWYQ